MALDGAGFTEKGGDSRPCARTHLFVCVSLAQAAATNNRVTLEMEHAAIF
jgi:hypothetical protein